VIIWLTDKGRIEQDAKVGAGATIITYTGPDATIKGAEFGKRKWEMARPCKICTGYTVVLSNTFGV